MISKEKYLEKEMIDTIVSNSPGMAEQPIADDMYQMVTPYVDEVTKEGDDRLRLCEHKITELIQRELTTSKGIEVRFTELIGLVDNILLPDYKDQLSPGLRDDLEATLRDRLQDINFLKDKSDVSCRALALLILDDLGSIFEHDLRLKIRDQAPIAFNTAMSSDISTEDKKMLLVKTLLRNGLWAGSAFTSWLGICKAIAILNDGVLPAWTESIANATVGTGLALAMSQVLKDFKTDVERAGATKGFSLARSVSEVLDKRAAYTFGIALLAMADVGTNVQGVSEIWLGRTDTADQLKIAYEQIGESRKEVDEILNSVSDEERTAEDVEKMIGVLIDEANGAFSAPGFGPRFYGVAAAYLTGVPFETIDDPNDSRLTGCKGISKDDWTIGQINQQAWCVKNNGTVHKKDYGFVVLDSSSETADQILSQLSSRYSGDYAKAYQLYLDFSKSHPDSYMEALEQYWAPYEDTVGKEINIQFQNIDQIQGSWSSGSMITAINEGIDNINAAFEIIGKTVNTEAVVYNANVKQIDAAYVDFDALLIKKLAPNEQAVNVPSQHFIPTQVSVKSIDTLPLENRTFYKMVEEGVSGEGEVGNKFLIAFALALTGVGAAAISYLDMFFFPAVRRAYQRDLDKVSKTADKTLGKEIANLLQSLYDHLNRGPFANLYGDKAKGEISPQAFVEERFNHVMNDLCEEERFDSVEHGFLYSLRKQFFSLFKDGGEVKPFKDEMKAAIASFPTVDSRPIQAHRRFVNALGRYIEEPETFRDRVMNLKNGDQEFTPGELIDALANGKAHSTSELSRRFREEMQASVHGVARESTREGETSTERIEHLQQSIQAMNPLDVTDETWLVRFFKLRDLVLMEIDRSAIFQNEKEKKMQLENEWNNLLSKYSAAISAHEAQLGKGMKRIKSAMETDERDVADNAYNPEFESIGRAINETRHVLNPKRNEGLMSTEKHRALIKEKIQNLEDIAKEVKKLRPPFTHLRAIKMQLLASCSTVMTELAQSMNLLDGDIGKLVSRNRRKALVSFVRRHEGKQSFDEESANTYIAQFTELYNRIFEAMPEKVSISQTDEENCFDKVGLSYESFARKFKEDAKAFGFDEGLNRTLNPVFKIGKTLEKALLALGSKVKIEVPDPLDPIKVISVKY